MTVRAIVVSTCLLWTACSAPMTDEPIQPEVHRDFHSYARPDEIRIRHVAMDLTVLFVIVPLVAASLFTGLIQSLGTTWGLFRHYWVLAKLLLTVFVAIVLLLQLDGISYLAGAAAETTLSGADLRAARMSPVVHAGGGLLVLLVTVALSLYKPSGMTRYGWRRQHDTQTPSRP